MAALRWVLCADSPAMLAVDASKREAVEVGCDGLGGRDSAWKQHDARDRGERAHNRLTRQDTTDFAKVAQESPSLPSGELDATGPCNAYLLTR